jgi:hypothetical protein
MLIVLVS